ncbi:p-hydroxybenzoic acid efflux pump subunit AaeA [compost metagenome]
MPLVALVDIHSFYVQGYFEETKLRHIQVGRPAEVMLYSTDQVLKGEVESLGRAIHDQSLEGGDSLLLDVKPNVPWVRLAQRVPVRIRLLEVPPELALIAGTTCTITLGE